MKGKFVVFQLLSTLFILVGLFSCKKKYFTPEWDTKILTPIAKSSLSVSDLIKNDDLIKADSADFMSVVYTNEIYKLENPLDSIISLSIDPFNTVVTLQTLSLGEQEINDSIKIGDLLAQIPPGFPTIPDGGGFPAIFLPTLNGFITSFNTNTSEVDISEFLVEAFLNKALFDIKIENNTTFQIIGLSYKIKNTEDGAVLIEGIIDTIQPNTTFEDLNIDIADQLGGNPVKGLLSIESGGFTLGIPSGLGGVPLNYSDYLAFNASLHDIEVLKATAQFPAQEVVNNTDVIDIYAEDEVELTYARIDTGIVNISGFSSIPVDINFTYSVPNLSKNGSEFSISSSLDTTYNSSTNSGDTNFFFNDYDFDMTVAQSPYFRNFNALLNTLVATIDSTEGVLEISLSDSIDLTIAVTKIKPSYARGYLGSTLEQITETVMLDAFNGVEGKINFEEVKLELQLQNEIGVSGEIKINSITARNTKTGASETYTGNKGPFSIAKATEFNESFVAAQTVIELDGAENLLSIFPDAFDVDFEFITNASGNNQTYSDFIHSGASITANINLDIPLVASVEGLILADTVDFTLDNVEVPAEFKEGVFSLIVDNGFPLELDVDIYFLNGVGAVIDSLSSEQIVKSAIVDPVSQIVTEKTTSKIDYYFDNFDLSALTSAQKMVFKAKFDTENTQVVKFYDFYSLDVQLIADFEYQVNKGK